MDEFEHEPIPGLPQRPPPGEAILWQGSPTWRASAQRSFHVVGVGVYFLLLSGVRLVFALKSGASVLAALGSAALVMGVGLAAIGLLAGLAILVARTTVYTITSRRVVMRFGMALPMAINLPYALIHGAALKTHQDDTGDLPITLAPGNKVGYVLMWPHVRPWHFNHPQPMLRGVPEPIRVAAILADALRAAQASVAGTAAAPAAALPGVRAAPATTDAATSSAPVAA
jgi:hypothetical protein